MKFANPEAFLLFIPLFLVAFYSWTQGVRYRSKLIIPIGSWVDKRPRFSLPSPFRLQYALRLVALSFCVVALARPQEVFTKIKRSIDAVDILVTLDLSKSMDAIDFKPNRHTVAVETLSRFVDMRPDDRIGLVLFSGDAYLAVPLTTDHKVVKQAIVDSSAKFLQDGTAIGQAIAVGVQHLKNSKAKSRIIVLLTDGDNNMGSVDPITAAELARAYGVKVYSIGIGKKGRVPFPIKTVDPLGREVEVYQYLTDAVNDELMSDISNRTKGRFFRAEEQGLLNRFIQTIDSLEKTRIESSTLTRFSEAAWPWLIAAVLLLLAEGLALNTRWRKIP